MDIVTIAKKKKKKNSFLSSIWYNQKRNEKGRRRTIQTFLSHSELSFRACVDTHFIIIQQRCFMLYSALSWKIIAFEEEEEKSLLSLNFSTLNSHELLLACSSTEMAKIAFLRCWVKLKFFLLLLILPFSCLKVIFMWVRERILIIIIILVFMVMMVSLIQPTTSSFLLPTKQWEMDLKEEFMGFKVSFEGRFFVD